MDTVKVYLDACAAYIDLMGKIKSHKPLYSSNHAFTFIYASTRDYKHQ